VLVRAIRGCSIPRDLLKIQARATAQCRLQLLATHLAKNKIYLDFLSPFGRTIISASLRARSSIILLERGREFLFRFAQTIGFAVRLPRKLLDLLSWLLL
jgi:hypothetical protein